MKIIETLERERRWLLAENPEDAKRVLGWLENLTIGCEISEIKQWYISTNPVLRLRAHDDREYVLCIKTRGTGTGFGVPEKEAELSKEEFDNLFKFVKKKAIRKTRYFIPLVDSDLIAEVDVFQDSLDGLIIVEVEFPNDEQAKAFSPPPWFFANEITGNKSYANSTFYESMPIIEKI